MDELDPFEPGTHSFSGVVKAWSQNAAELVTDSGLVIFLNTQGQPAVPIGARITITARKLRPTYLVTRVAGT